MTIAPKDMGTTGLCDWVLAGKTFRSQGQRKRQACKVIADRYDIGRVEYFKRALAASTPNRAAKLWAIS